MTKIIAFLKKNGFIRMKKNSYTNDKCNVVILSNGYCVADNSGYEMFSKNCNIYWLIGVLTYYDFIEKDYKI